MSKEEIVKRLDHHDARVSVRDWEIRVLVSESDYEYEHSDTDFIVFCLVYQGTCVMTSVCEDLVINKFLKETKEK